MNNSRINTDTRPFYDTMPYCDNITSRRIHFAHTPSAATQGRTAANIRGMGNTKTGRSHKQPLPVFRD